MRQGGSQSLVIMAVQRGYGATVARLTPDQTVGRSNRSGLILLSLCGVSPRFAIAKCACSDIV